MIPEWMLLDQYLIPLMKGNIYTGMLLFGILVGLAKISPYTWDEAVLNAIIAPFKSVFDALSSKSK
jgi:F0F1-type ATP synthase membrane subunit a